MLNKILSPHPTIYKYDRAWVGIIIGLIVPLSGIGVIYLLSLISHYMSPGHPPIIPLSVLLQSSTRDLTSLTHYMSVGCMLNLGVFFLFINRDYFNVCRGVILSTILISIPVIVVIVIGWFK